MLFFETEKNETVSFAKKGRNDNAIATSSVARILLEGEGLKMTG